MLRGMVKVMCCHPVSGRMAYPLVSGLLAASGAKPVLAAEADFLLVLAFPVVALEYRIAPHRQPAALHFENVIDDSLTHVMFVYPKEAPPCATLAEQVFKTCWKANCLSIPFLCWAGAFSYAASD